MNKVTEGKLFISAAEVTGVSAAPGMLASSFIVCICTKYQVLLGQQCYRILCKRITIAALLSFLIWIPQSVQSEIVRNNCIVQQAVHYAFCSLQLLKGIQEKKKKRCSL